jgi:hypothetical protein
MEEAFIVVCCHLVYGDGWVDTEQEDVDRVCSWVPVSIFIQNTEHRIT